MSYNNSVPSTGIMTSVLHLGIMTSVVHLGAGMRLRCGVIQVLGLRGLGARGQTGDRGPRLGV